MPEVGVEAAVTLPAYHRQSSVQGVEIGDLDVKIVFVRFRSPQGYVLPEMIPLRRSACRHGLALVSFVAVAGVVSKGARDVLGELMRMARGVVWREKQLQAKQLQPRTPEKLSRTKKELADP